MKDRIMQIILVIVVAAVFLLLIKAYSSINSIANSPNAIVPTTIQSTIKSSEGSGSIAGAYKRIYIGQNSTFYGMYTIGLRGVDQQSKKAALTIQVYGYTLNFTLGQQQYVSLTISNNGPPYLLINQTYSNGSRSWAAINVSYVLPSGFANAHQGSYNISKIRSSGGSSYTPQNIGACSTNSTYFYVFPIAFSNFSSITPLGWASPGGHVLPSDHVYINLNLPPGTSLTPNVLPINTTVFAPGNITIYRISQRTYSSTGYQNTDYSLYFAPCNNVSAYFHHMHIISSKLMSNLSSATKSCYNGTINSQQIRGCDASVNIKVKTGEILGYIGGVPFSSGGSSSLDFGVYDVHAPALIYANASRYQVNQLHAACPMNYYPQSMKSVLLAKMGQGGIVRTQLPLCGQNDQDVIGTVQGNWFPANTPFPYTNEGPLISLFRDNLIASEELFSIGSSSNIPGLSGVTYYFNQTYSGLVNKDFSNVTADGNVYCYNSLNNNYAGKSSVAGTVLLQLVSTNTLRIEYKSSSGCGGGPWSFTSNHMDFYR